MIINLYKNLSDKRYRTKNLDLIASEVNCIIKGDASVSDPELDIAYDTGYLDCNYIYIPAWHRYYYARLTVTQQRIYITCHVDVLMSAGTALNSCDCIVGRNESAYNAYLNDAQLPVLDKQQVNTIVFPQGFSNSDKFVLITTSGGGGGDNNE